MNAIWRFSAHILGPDDADESDDASGNADEIARQRDRQLVLNLLYPDRGDSALTAPCDSGTLCGKGARARGPQAATGAVVEPVGITAHAGQPSTVCPPAPLASPCKGRAAERARKAYIAALKVLHAARAAQEERAQEAEAWAGNEPLPTPVEAGANMFCRSRSPCDWERRRCETIGVSAHRRAASVATTAPTSCASTGRGRGRGRASASPMSHRSRCSSPRTAWSDSTSMSSAWHRTRLRSDDATRAFAPSNHSDSTPRGMQRVAFGGCALREVSPHASQQQSQSQVVIPTSIQSVQPPLQQGIARNADSSTLPTSPQARPRAARTARGRRLDEVLAAPSVNMKSLADLVWLGVPEERQRGEAWQLLLEYSPLLCERRSATLLEKRCEYKEFRSGIYEGSSCSSKTSGEEKAAALQQIRIDLPRTELCSGAPDRDDVRELQTIVDSEVVQAIMERVLFVWSVKQPTAGYVQGMNDVLLPLLFVFLSDRAAVDLCDLSLAVVEAMPAAMLDDVEADCYWCLSCILGDVMDHYVEGQPGVCRATQLLTERLAETHGTLAENFEREGADLRIIAVRWLGCLMVREVPMALCARLWDTCLAESALVGRGRGFTSFLVNVCVGVLASHESALQAAPFDELMEFMLRPPTAHLVAPDLESLISGAFVLSSTTHSTPMLQEASAPTAPDTHHAAADGVEAVLPANGVPSDGHQGVEVEAVASENNVPSPGHHVVEVHVLPCEASWNGADRSPGGFEASSFLEI